MATELDVPHLVVALATCLAEAEGMKPCAQVVQTLTNVAHSILFGLHEAELLDVEEHRRCSFNALRQEQGSVFRKPPPANDLFIPHHLPFDLTAPEPQHPPTQHPPSQRPPPQQLQQNPHSNPCTSSSQAGAPLLSWQVPQGGCDLNARRSAAEFKLIPSPLFEQLSDPNRLNGGGSGSHADCCGLEGTPAGPMHGGTVWGTEGVGIDAQLDRMQQKPVWELTGPASRPQDAPSHKAVGGMPYSLPLALLHMDAEPGSLTSFSSQPWEEGAFADGDLRLAHSPQEPPQPASIHPHTALAPLQQTLAPAHSTLASLPQNQSQVEAEPTAHGTSSLRSSDEFPANKENSHEQRPSFQGRGAPAAKAVATAGGGADAADVVSEQVLAQEAVYALQGVGSSIRRLKEGKLRTPTVHASSLASILRPIVQSGEQRQTLEAFIAAFGVGASSSPATSSSHADPVLQAFAAAVHSILRWHTSALNQLPAAVKQRRQAERSMQSVQSTGMSKGGAVPPVTILEVVLHTRHLQAQLLSLSRICLNEPATASQPLPSPPVKSRRAEAQSASNNSDKCSEGDSGAFPSCQWAILGFPKGPALLSHLYAELAEAEESHAAPLARFLFVSAFRPYMHHMRTWMYSTAEVDPAFAENPSETSLAQLPDSKMGLLPQALPHFLQLYSQHFILAGRQLRILNQMNPSCKLYVSQVGAIASSEGAEASLLLPQAPGPLEDCMPSWGLSMPPAPGFLPSALQLHAFPLVFDSQALQQVGAVRGQASKERLYEADRLLTNLAEQRQMADDAVTAQVLLRKQQLCDSREAVRAQKAEEGRQRRLYRAQLLSQQQAAMTAQQSRLQAERAIRIRQEQQVLEFAARQEHSAAAAAVAAAAAAAKQELSHMHEARHHLAWRTQRWSISQLRRAAIETAEAVEDAELQVLLRSPALRQPPLAPAALAQQDTLMAIGGFRGFQEPVPEHNAPRLAVPVTVESQAVSPARRAAVEIGEKAAISMTKDADIAADMTDAAESSDRAGNGEAATGVAGRARGKWGAPRQPFIAAGRHTSSKETAAQLMSSGLVPTAVASSGTRGATAVAKEAQLTTAAGLVDPSQHEAATAESAVATSAADSQLPHSSTNPEEPIAFTDIIPAATSPQQRSADAEQASQLQAEQQHAQQAQHDKTRHAQQQHSQHAQQESAQQAQQQRAQQEQQQQDKQQRAQQAQQAQQAVATAEGGTQLVDKAAAGSYRRVAWAPVQNPFPAAGAISAVTTSAMTTSAKAISAKIPSAQAPSAQAPSAETMASGTTAAGAKAAPASVPSCHADAVQPVDLPQDRHALDCTPAEQSPEPAQDSAQQLKIGLSRGLELGHSLAHDLEGEEGETSLSGTTERQRRSRGAWVGVAQPLTAAGVGSSVAAAQGSTSSSAAAAAATGISRLEAAAMPRKRHGWNLEGAEGTEIESALHDHKGSWEHQAGALGRGQDEEGLVPLSVVMDACLAQGVLEQYRCVSKACLGLFLDELKLMDLLRTFQRYFFMGAGDWAENLTGALCAHTAQHGVLHEHNVQSMVEVSLKGTSVELDPDAANLKATLRVPSGQLAAASKAASRASPKQMAGARRASPISEASPNINTDSHSTEAASRANGGDAVQQLPGSCQALVIIGSTQLDALDAVQLSFHMQWPLSLIITREAVQQYSAVFSWLLCLKRVSLLMRNLWLDLAACARWSSQASCRRPEAQGESMGGVVQQRLRILQLFRHEAAHLVAALQEYMQGQLLGTCWHQLQKAVTNEVTDLAELQHAHMQYLAHTRHHCLMSQNTRELRAIVEPVVQCIVDFTNSCRSRSGSIKDMQDLLEDQGRWTSVYKSIQEFQLRTSVLYKVLKYANGRGHYQELFVQLDFNNHYAD